MAKRSKEKYHSFVNRRIRYSNCRIHSRFFKDLFGSTIEAMLKS